MEPRKIVTLGPPGPTLSRYTSTSAPPEPGGTWTVTFSDLGWLRERAFIWLSEAYGPGSINYFVVQAKSGNVVTLYRPRGLEG
jgi:hypothetical protein